MGELSAVTGYEHAENLCVFSLNTCGLNFKNWAWSRLCWRGWLPQQPFWNTSTRDNHCYSSWIRKKHWIILCKTYCLVSKPSIMYTAQIATTSQWEGPIRDDMEASNVRSWGLALQIQFSNWKKIWCRWCLVNRLIIVVHVELFTNYNIHQISRVLIWNFVNLGMLYA